MEESWQTYITILANIGSPATDEQLSKLIAGWERYFRMVGISDPDKQKRELKHVLSVRIAVTGNISILAPEDNDILLPELRLDEQ